MIHSCVQETDQLIVAALQYLYWASFKQASSESITRRRFQQQQILYFIYTIIFVENGMGHPRRRTLAPKKSCISSRHQKLPWTLGKRQLCIAGLSRVHNRAWSTVWEQGLSSQLVRYPGDHINTSRLLYGDCRGQSDLQAMWTRTSLFFLAHPSLSQTQLASPTVWFQEAMQGQVPTLQKQEGKEALLSQRRAALPGVLYPPNCAEPSPRPTNRQHPGGLCRGRSFTLNIAA